MEVLSGGFVTVVFWPNSVFHFNLILASNIGSNLAMLILGPVNIN